MTCAEWIRSASERLFAAGVESSALEAQVLAAHAAGKDRSWVLAHGSDELPSPVVKALASVLERRIRREPLAYILGWREFYGLRFSVSPAVLIPRQETELLVDVGVELVRAVKAPRILDVGTGSGCVAIALKRELPHARITALDVSREALKVARDNANALQTDVTFVLSDGFLSLPLEQFDLVVSNPPYVAKGDPLPPEVREFEPSTALYAATDGLDFYRRLSTECKPYLTAKGSLAVEIGIGQADAVSQTFAARGWVETHRRLDLSGIERVLVLRLRA